MERPQHLELSSTQPVLAARWLQLLSMPPVRLAPWLTICSKGAAADVPATPSVSVSLPRDASNATAVLDLADVLIAILHLLAIGPEQFTLVRPPSSILPAFPWTVT